MTMMAKMMILESTPKALEKNSWRTFVRILDVLQAHLQRPSRKKSERQVWSNT
jgi:hypothetical protein